MADRYTIKDAERSFELLLKVLGKRKAQRYNDVGAWRLDYAPQYGGVIVVQIINTGGGLTHPLMQSRLSPKEFCRAVNFTISANEAARRG